MITPEEVACCTKALPSYATDTSYICPPSEDLICKGVCPLDSLPAQWWNWLWNQTTCFTIGTSNLLNNLYSELSHVLSAAGATPTTTDTRQLSRAICTLIQNVRTCQVATTDALGGVTSDTVALGVKVNETTGKMSVNRIGNLYDLDTPLPARTGNDTTLIQAINSIVCFTGKCSDLLTTAKSSLVTAINELYTKTDVIGVDSCCTATMGAASKNWYVCNTCPSGQGSVITVESYNSNSEAVPTISLSARTPAAVGSISLAPESLISGVNFYAPAVYSGECLVCTAAYPTVNNGTLTICANGSSCGTFTANQSSASTVTINAVACAVCGKNGNNYTAFGSNAFNSTAFTTCTGNVSCNTNITSAIKFYGTGANCMTLSCNLDKMGKICWEASDGQGAVMTYTSYDNINEAIMRDGSVHLMGFTASNTCQRQWFVTDYICGKEAVYSGGKQVCTAAYPSVGNGTLTICANGGSCGTFTANQSSASTVTINAVTCAVCGKNGNNYAAFGSNAFNSTSFAPTCWFCCCVSSATNISSAICIGNCCCAAGAYHTIYVTACCSGYVFIDTYACASPYHPLFRTCLCSCQGGKGSTSLCLFGGTMCSGMILCGLMCGCGRCKVGIYAYTSCSAPSSSTCLMLYRGTICNNTAGCVCWVFCESGYIHVCCMGQLIRSL